MALTGWATHVLQWWRQRAQARARALANPQKPSQFRLRSATRAHEGGIAAIAEQQAAVNTFPGLVHTARHTMGVGLT